MHKRAESIETALTITVGLLALYFWLGHIWLLRSAMLISCLGLFWPGAAMLLHRGWMYLAQGLGWFNSRILLSVLFFAILTPIAWLARLFGSSSIQLKRKAQGETYYIVRDHAYTQEDLEQMW